MPTVMPVLPATDLPPPGSYRLDPRRCVVDATTRQMLVSSVRARFTAHAGRLEVSARDPLASWVRIDLDSGSARTGLAARDEALRGPEILDAAAHPWIRFESALVSDLGPRRFQVEGDLYIRDRVVPLSVVARLTDSPPGRVLVAAEGTLSWRSLGLGWGSILERAGLLGDKLTVSAAAEFVR